MILWKKTRLLSKANIANRRQKNPFNKLSKEIKKVNPKNLFKLTRAYNHFMNLYNLAESIDASRTLDIYENTKKDKKLKNIFIEEIFENFFKTKKYQIVKFIMLQNNYISVSYLQHILQK